jgi:hypothetical protein
MRLFTLLMFFSISSSAQNMIVYQIANFAYVRDVETSSQWIVDSTLFHNERIVDVSIKSDSILCSYVRNGSFEKRTYWLSQIRSIPVSKEESFVYRSKPDSYYRHNFYHGKYRLVIYDAGVSLLISDSVLWSSSKTNPFNVNLDKNRISSLHPFESYPILSPDSSHFLLVSKQNSFFSSKFKLYEFHIPTGKRKLISSKGFDYRPSYSSNGRFILYVDFISGDFGVFDRNEQSKTSHFGFKNAFWLKRF